MMRNFGRLRRIRIQTFWRESDRDFIRDAVDDFKGRSRHPDGDYRPGCNDDDSYLHVNGKRLRIRQN